jgi:hypothetical protein
LTGSEGDTTSSVNSGREWLASLPAELAAQRRVMAGLVDFCAATPVVTSLWVGCSLGREAGDALSDIDAALGIAAERGHAGAEQVLATEAAVIALLPSLGPIVDVLRHRIGRADQFARRIFAQFADRTQLDLAVIAEAEVRRGAQASATVLTQVSVLAAQRWQAELPEAMARYVTAALEGGERLGADLP